MFFKTFVFILMIQDFKFNVMSTYFNKEILPN